MTQFPDGTRFRHVTWDDVRQKDLYWIIINGKIRRLPYGAIYSSKEDLIRSFLESFSKNEWIKIYPLRFIKYYQL